MGHVHLMVADPDSQKKLWVNVLGAEVTHMGSLEMLKLPGIFIVVGKARTPPSEGTEGSTVNHVGFLVKSYADMKAKLLAAGLTLASDNAADQTAHGELSDKVKVEFTEDATLKAPVAMHHIHISTPDPEKAARMVREDVRREGRERGETSWPPRFPAARWISGRRSRPKLPPRAGRSITSVSRSKHLAGFCKKLQADGVTFDMAYREMPQLGGLKIAFIVDPEGTRIELTEGLAGQ